jgi:hypothetical protein
MTTPMPNVAAPWSEELTRMLERQLAFQRHLGFDFAAMSTRERVDYVKQMYVAAVKELGEALDETSWKNWAKGEFFHEDAVLGELIDVTCFLLNLFFVACPDLTPHELANMIDVAHETKTSINRRRQVEGYDGTAKCPQCKRALDDPAVECETSTDGYHCVKTGTTYLNDAHA